VNADVTVTSFSGVAIFNTESLQLTVSPGKYRVEVKAEGFLRFYYVVDLRSTTVDEPLAVPLQKSSQCHDIRIITGEEAGEEKCASEVVRPNLPNLALGTATVISGQVKDQSGAPLANSAVVLKKVSGSLLQPGWLDTKTDEQGRFALSMKPNLVDMDCLRLRIAGLSNPRSLNVMGSRIADLRSC
jgi:hypothetical protein